MVYGAQQNKSISRTKSDINIYADYCVAQAIVLYMTLAEWFGQRVKQSLKNLQKLAYM